MLLTKNNFFYLIKISITIILIISTGMLSGCMDKTDQKIIYEGLRDAPTNPSHPDYQDFIENISKSFQGIDINLNCT